MEFLALNLITVDKYYGFLYGAEIKTMTYKDPLTYPLTLGKLDLAGQRWVSALFLYNFETVYRSRNNTVKNMRDKLDKQSKLSKHYLEISSILISGNHGVLKFAHMPSRTSANVLWGNFSHHYGFPYFTLSRLKS